MLLFIIQTAFHGNAHNLVAFLCVFPIRLIMRKRGLRFEKPKPILILTVIIPGLFQSEKRLLMRVVLGNRFLVEIEF